MTVENYATFVKSTAVPVGAEITPAGDRRVPVSLSRLRGVLIVAETIRPASSLEIAAGRSILDLPIDTNRSILSHILESVAPLRAFVEPRMLPVRLLTDPIGARRLFGAAHGHPFHTIEQQPFETRGTGGVIADAVRELDRDDMVLVFDHPLIPEEMLGAVARELCHCEGDVSLVANPDHTASGVMLMRAGSLRAIPRIGRFEIRRHGLPLMAATNRVQVLHRPQNVGSAVQNLPQYIAMLQRSHRNRAAENPKADQASWRPSFSITENGADVGPGAHLYDSVVLAGGRVETGATVVRSVVGPGGVVKRRRTCIDSLVSMNGIV